MKELNLIRAADFDWSFLNFLDALHILIIKTYTLVIQLSLTQDLSADKIEKHSLNLMFIYRFSAISSCAPPTREQQLPVDLLNFSHLLCVCCTPEISICLPRRPRLWFRRGPIIPGTCSSSGSRTLRTAVMDAPLCHCDLVRRVTQCAGVHTSDMTESDALFDFSGT